MIGIYKITSPSGKIYVGQSRDIKERWKTHKWKAGREQSGRYPLYWSMQKYGIDNHKFEVIEECKFEDLNVKERYWQDFYNVLKEGLNAKLQETETKPRVYTEEIRKRISEKSKKLKHSEETKARIAKSLSEKVKGVPKSEKHRKAMSIARTGVKMGPMSEEDKLKKSISAKKQRVSSRKKCIYCERVLDNANMAKHVRRDHHREWVKIK